MVGAHEGVWPLWKGVHGLTWRPCVLHLVGLHLFITSITFEIPLKITECSFFRTRDIENSKPMGEAYLRRFDAIVRLKFGCEVPRG